MYWCGLDHCVLGFLGCGGSVFFWGVGEGEVGKAFSRCLDAGVGDWERQVAVEQAQRFPHFAKICVLFACWTLDR